MEGFEYQGSSAGLRRRFEELKRLDVRDFPNAAHDLLRTVLECAIKDHFASSATAVAGQQDARPVRRRACSRWGTRSDRRMTNLDQ